MKRGEPLRRKTPLKQGRPLERKTPLQRSSPRESKPKTRKRMKPLTRGTMDKDLRASVIERANGRCEHCGKRVRPAHLHAHHRKLRTRGGEDTRENLVAVAGDCHSWIHENPAEATRQGFMVNSWDDPATIPVLYHQQEERLLR